MPVPREPSTVNRRSRKVLLLLTAEEYEQLEAIAERETRTPDQQATHWVRLALQAAQPGRSGQSRPLG